MSRQFYFAIVLSVLSSAVCAQSEKFDIATYTPPMGWKKDTKSGVVSFTTINPQSGGYCVLGIYAAKPSGGSPEKDFNSEWEELVVGPFGATKNPTTELQTSPDGWKAITGAASITFNGNSAYVVLTTFSGFGKTTSILATLNDQQYLPAIDSFLEKLQLDKKATVKTSSPAIESNNKQLIGKWAKSASSPFSLDPGAVLTNQGYYKCQYDLKADGTYAFRGESWGGYLRSNDYSKIEETGTYSIRGNLLIISPATSKMILTDSNGKIKKTETLSLAKRNFRWQLHYFEGIGETNLVLTSDKEYLQDGGFAGMSAFPNSYLYSQHYKPEWKFLK